MPSDDRGDPPPPPTDAPTDAAEAAAEAAPSPAVSLMITRRQKGALRDLGVTEDEIRHMTPAEAHARLGL